MATLPKLMGRFNFYQNSNDIPHRIGMCVGGDGNPKLHMGTQRSQMAKQSWAKRMVPELPQHVTSNCCPESQ